MQNNWLSWNLWNCFLDVCWRGQVEPGEHIRQVLEKPQGYSHPSVDRGEPRSVVHPSDATLRWAEHQQDEGPLCPSRRTYTKCETCETGVKSTRQSGEKTTHEEQIFIMVHQSPWRAHSRRISSEDGRHGRTHGNIAKSLPPSFLPQNLLFLIRQLIWIIEPVNM